MRRGWQLHVKSAIVYCHVHFDREIARAAETINITNNSVHIWMRAILEAKSREEYYRILSEIESKQRLTSE